MLAPGLQILADSCRSITTLVGFNKCRANVSITVLGNPKTVVLAARGILPDVHANPGHQFPGVRKSFDVTNLCNHRQCKGILDAFVTGQGLNRWLLAWRACQHFDLLTILDQNLIERLKLTQ